MDRAPRARAQRASGAPPQSSQASPDPLAPHSLSPRERRDLIGAERAGEPFLVGRDGDGRLLLFTLGSDDATKTIGRRTETDVSIPWDSEVSSLHAELQCLAGEWLIVDDGLSTNGTYVNARRVSARKRLRDGDRIRVGQTVFAFNAAYARPAGTTTPAVNVPVVPELTDTQRRVLIALCRPYGDKARFATPASNQQIAAEVFLSVDAVKTHLRALFQHFQLGALPQNRKRARLAECALTLGLVSEHDLREQQQQR